VGSALAKPEYVNPPEVVGRVALGERLVCGSGTWKGSPRFEYEWVREGIGVVKAPYYFLTKEDEHKEVWCVVTATEGAEKAFAESVNSVCLGGRCHEEPGIPPEIKEPPAGLPEVSGSPEVGKTLTCSKGSWTGRPPPTFAYKWLRDKEAIKSATNPTYTVVAEDETHALSCRVTASNEAGEATAESKNSLSVAGSPPKNTSIPKVLGVRAVGETLTCYEGAWSGSSPITFKFQWLRNGAPIPGATGSTRVVEAADEGSSLSCRVTAENKEGKEVVLSEPVPITGKLRNLVAPVISGSEGGIVKEGTVLTCSEGSWSQAISELKLKFVWLRDNEAIGGATAKQYTVASADRKHLIYCQVAARNEAKKEEAAATTEPVRFPGSGVPTVVSQPEISGSPAVVGHSLTCKEGVWTKSPTQYVFQWLRDKTAIGSATGAQYEVKTADQGHSLSCKVIAVNAEGPSEPAESLELPVSGMAPSDKSPPEVYPESSPRRVGESLTCLRGEWTGAPPPTFTYTWLRDGASVGSGASYTITSADRGHSLSCTVTATNIEKPEGVPAASKNSLYIPGTPPEPPLEGPKVSGEATVGSVLTCAEGAWTGAPAPTFTIQWLLNGQAISGATNPSFRVESVDRGFLLSCRVTGTSREGTAWAVSKGVHVLGVPPELIEPPFVTGEGAVGQTLTCQRGVWNGKPPPSFTYRWLRDGVAIAAATEGTYPIEPVDQGHLLSCDVIAANSEGTVEAESINGAAIASHITPTTSEKPVTGHFTPPGGPSAGVILAALNRQLSYALSGLHIRAVLRAGGHAFSFISPTAGTLELLWYIPVKGAHGARGKQLVVAQLNTAFKGSKNGTIKLRLTNNGRRVLKSKKHMSLRAVAIFTIPHGKPVVWSATITLGK
jgi:hypothetical protein